MRKRFFKTAALSLFSVAAIASLAGCDFLGSSSDSTEDETVQTATDENIDATSAASAGTLNVAQVIISDKPWYGYLDLIEPEEQTIDDASSTTDTSSSPEQPQEEQPEDSNQDAAQTDEQNQAPSTEGLVGDPVPVAEEPQDEAAPEPQQDHMDMFYDTTPTDSVEPSMLDDGSGLEENANMSASRKDAKYWLVDLPSSTSSSGGTVSSDNNSNSMNYDDFYDDDLMSTQDNSSSQSLADTVSKNTANDGNSSSSSSSSQNSGTLSDSSSSNSSSSSSGASGLNDFVDGNTTSSSGASGLNDFVQGNNNSSSNASSAGSTSNSDSENSGTSLKDFSSSSSEDTADAFSDSESLESIATGTSVGKTLPNKEYDVSSAEDLYQISCSIEVEGIAGLTAQAVFQVTRGTGSPVIYPVEFEMSDDHQSMEMTCQTEANLTSTLWVSDGTTPVLTVPISFLLSDLSETSSMVLPSDETVDIRLSNTASEAESSASVIDILTGDVGVAQKSIFGEVAAPENNNGVSINSYTLVYDKDIQEWLWVNNNNIINAGVDTESTSGEATS